MKPYFKYSFLVLSMLITTLIVSCKKFMEIDSPIDKVSVSSAFQDSTTATSALLLAYVTMTDGLDNIITNCTGISSDELTYNSTSPSYLSFLSNDIEVDNSINNTIWTTAYSQIYSMNLVIEKMSLSKNISPEYKNQIIGEAKFARAWLYYYLVSLFGDVPLITSTDYRVNSVMPRTPIETVQHQIIEDLQDAKNKLKVEYVMPNRVRPNKHTAAALLARVYLNLKQWSNAESQVNSILQSGIYSLSSPASAFLKGSSETIWQLYPSSPAYNTPDANYFIPSSSATTRPQFSLTDNLYNSFENGDLRKSLWTSSKVVGGVTYNYPYKYKVKTGSNLTATEFPIVFRLAEQYLIRAEARAQQSRLVEAVDDLDTIRKRANLPLLKTTNPLINYPDLLLAIEKERRFELFADRGGFRWIDLKRTGRADVILRPFKGSTWQINDTLWPVPAAQRSLNVFLSQNTGYQQ